MQTYADMQRKVMYAKPNSYGVEVGMEGVNLQKYSFDRN